MRKGEVIHRKYVVADPMTGAGKSEVALATHSGKPVFLKKFTSPKYPYDPAKVDAAKLDKLKQACTEFEQRHIKILTLLSRNILGGGNLVKPIDFFREKGSYCKVYPLVQGEKSQVVVQEAAPDQRRLFVKTLLLSL